jgi:nitrogen fixation protein FixH
MSMNIPTTDAMPANRELKGKHVFAAFILFFGVIIAVNFTMARLASTSWTGLVVKNSYVASQQFNGELSNAQKQKALGLKSSVSYGAHTLALNLYDEDGNIMIADQLKAEIGRPAYEQADRVLDFMPLPNGCNKINVALDEGIWAVTVFGMVDGNQYRRDLRINVDKNGLGNIQ